MLICKDLLLIMSSLSASRPPFSPHLNLSTQLIHPLLFYTAIEVHKIKMIE